MNLPLKGIRVLAIEQFGAGPYGSMYLANFGAEVVKIESRYSGGDSVRQTGAVLMGEDDSAYFQGKRPLNQHLHSRSRIAHTDFLTHSMRNH
jgi:crotonobetainyl-CoA:carnitine CoA-transferase CaiB-like acyl-CoA transferase